MMTLLINGLVGIVMLVSFLGIMLWWIKALPLLIIVVVTVALALYDLVRTLRHGENGGRR